MRPDALSFARSGCQRSASALGSVPGWWTSGRRPSAAEDYGTHSLRRTKAIIHKTAGSLRAVQLLFVHTKIESTVRYLGIKVEDVLTALTWFSSPVIVRLLVPAP
jgi:hypothetical protein